MRGTLKKHRLGKVHDDWRIPVHARIVGVLMALAGSRVAFSLFAPTLFPRTETEIIVDSVVFILMIVGGIGLTLGFRWGWPPAVVVALAVFSGGIYAAFTPLDSSLLPIIVLVLPSAIALWSLIAPGTRKWLLLRPQARPGDGVAD